ncbi:MAG TPA: universal stress protein [Steroidobacteraceae bacterium]
MALKDLLVHVDQTDGALVRLRLAADLARRHGSRLTALYVRDLDPDQVHSQSTGEIGLVSAADMNRDNRRNVQAADDTAQRLTRELEAIRLNSVPQVELRSVEGSAASVVPQHARFADLCILSQQTRGDATAAGYTFSEEVLFSAGRPVVFVPAHGSFDTLGRHILVAWNSSRACARALNDALPLIERAERVTVLAINPTQYMDRYRALAPEQIVLHIRHHSATVEGIRLQGVPRDAIADAVQAEARRLGADLIVAGAFGHPKLWEQVVGGVTRDLLTQMTLPILMSY